MKVLLIHATIGWGHKRAAMALAEAFQERGIETDVRDLLDFLPRPLSRMYPGAYSFMVSRSRPLWRLFYKMNDWPKSPYAPATDWTQRWQFTNCFHFWKRPIMIALFQHTSLLQLCYWIGEKNSVGIKKFILW